MNKLTPFKPINPYFQNTDENPELEANKLISDFGWDGNSPIDLLELCDFNDFNYEFKPLEDGTDVIPGVTRFKSNGNVQITINTNGLDIKDNFSENVSIKRFQRFTLAHEVGHCTFTSHRDLGLQKALINDENPYSNIYNRQKERQANEFASYLLVPTEFLKKHLKMLGKVSMKKSIESVSEHFDVSLKVSIQRVGKESDYPVMVILFDKDGKCLRTPTLSKDGDELKLFFDQSNSLPEQSTCYDLFSRDTGYSYQSKKHPDKSVWFPNNYRDISIVEHAFRLGSYGYAVLLEVKDNDY